MQEAILTAAQVAQSHGDPAPADGPCRGSAAPPQRPAGADGMPCLRAAPHGAAPAPCQARRGSLCPWEAHGSPVVTTQPPPARSPLTLVEEDVACIEGDTGEDIVGGAGVTLVHPLDLHIQPAGRAEPC